MLVKNSEKIRKTLRQDLHVFSHDAVLGLVMREPVCPLRMVTVSRSKTCSGVAEGVEWMLKTKGLRFGVTDSPIFELGE
ncbi:hypothetical protein KCU95_g47, partial [Aureobasidium melanogenum]